MRTEFDGGALLFHDVSDDTLYTKWDDRADEYHAQAYRYRPLLRWASVWADKNKQSTLQDGSDHALEDVAWAYPALDLTPAFHIEPRDYQQVALDA